MSPAAGLSGSLLRPLVLSSHPGAAMWKPRSTCTACSSCLRPNEGSDLTPDTLFGMDNTTEWGFGARLASLGSDGLCVATRQLTAMPCGKTHYLPALPPVRYTVPWMEPSGLRPVAHDPKRTAQVRNMVCLWPL